MLLNTSPVNQIQFYLMRVARLFRRGEAICKDDFLRRVDMDEATPEVIRRFFHQVQFDEAVLDSDGRIKLDLSEGGFSDA